MKKTIKLNFINELEKNLKTQNNLIQVLIGPRQVGKTTTVLNFLECDYADKYHYVSADEVFNSSPQWLVDQWSIAQQEKKLLVIDEIQKCINWSATIKKLYDDSLREKNKIRCILLGSSSLQIQKGLSESLTGRFQLISAYHWNFHESQLGYKLDFNEYLKYGGYPGAYQFIKTEDWAGYIKQSIVSTVIEKDILQFNTVKNPSLFKQAFEILMSYPAQEISYTKLLGQLQDKGNVDLIKYYLSLYEGAFLIKTLEKFSFNKIRTKSSSPKILPLAPCLYYSEILSDYSPDEKGHVFELCVGAQLLRTGYELYYWREGKYEIDYIVKYGKRIWAIEVKTNKKRPQASYEEFKKRYPSSLYIIINENNYIEFDRDPKKFLNSL